MLQKTWNIRDQTEKNLRIEADRLYREIENGYKLIKRVSDIEDAKKILDSIWVKKKLADNIQLELIRREFNNEAQTENASKD